MSTDDEIIEKLQKASKLMQEHALFDQALEIFDSILKEKEEPINNPNIEKYEGAIHGIRGECLFSLNRMDEAIEASYKSIEASEASGDYDGVIDLYVNLYEIYRYTDNKEKALEACKKISELLEKKGDMNAKANYDKQYAIIEKGEPLNRMIVVIDGINYEMDELPSLQNSSLLKKEVKFNYIRNKISLPPSRHYERIGRELYTSGKHEESVEVLKKAISFDRFNPGPRYTLGLTYLYLKEYEKALKEFEAVEELAPSWFFTRHFIWLSKSLIKNEIDDNIFKLLHVLEEGNLTPQQKVVACERIIEQRKDYYPPIFYHLGVAYQQVKNIEYAEAAFRTVLKNENIDPDLKTRTLFNLALTVSSKEEKDKLLNEAIELSGHLTTAAMASIAKHL